MTQEALKYLQTGAIVPVDMETTRILVNALKEALVQQEPAATIAVREHAPVGKVAYVLEVDLPVGIHKLYTTPPERTWVGLTVKEVNDLYDSDYSAFHQRIEAKLKQKNG